MTHNKITTMTTLIRDFWLQNPDYWIATGTKQQAADKVIYDKFHGYDFTKEDNLGQIIYLDQLMRHFSRIEPVSESFIVECRNKAVKTINDDDLTKATDKELIWYLMPLKHLFKWDQIFQTIDNWLKHKGKPVTDFPYLNRFFMDTYKKAYSDETIAKNLILSKGPAPYNAELICESHPDLYTNTTTWTNLPTKDADHLLNPLTPLSKNPVAISLSGGVDSMLLTALLARAKADVVAVHIVYGNRQESIDERNFIATYCDKLNIPLYIYTITWLKRTDVDRAFYESITRNIRFSAYKAISRPVILGHIQDDLVENIWTNFAKGANLDNLAKFTPISVEDTVTICRPWLQIKKQQIYDLATTLAIPHLKNTTPSWSNRGKFRTHFYEATQNQYGLSVDTTLINVAKRLKNQAQLLDKLLYSAINNSWDPILRQINITQAISIDLDADGWQRILTDLAHTKLHITMPSFVACEDFRVRISRGLKHGQKIHLHKNFPAQIVMTDDQIWLKVI
jgi:tRNA(Ile)-lysidine synthetase-like protein